MEIAKPGSTTGLFDPTMVDKLIQVERMPIESAEKRKEKIVEEKTEFESLVTLVNDLDASLYPLRSKLDFYKMKVESSHPDILDGEVQGYTIPGSYEFEVRGLAKNEKELAYGFPDKDETSVGFGYMLIGRDDKEDLEVTIEPDSTLEDVVTQINAAEAGVTAMVINTKYKPDPYRLLVISNDSGKEAKITLDEDTTYLEFKEQVTGRNLDVLFEDVPVTDEDNSLEALVDGVIFNARRSEPGTRVQVNVTYDIDKTLEGITAFVEKYNEVSSFINKQFVVDPKTNRAGILAGDSSIKQIMRTLQGAVVTSVKTGGKFSTLAEIGITTDPKTGNLKMDDTKVRQALTDDYESAAKLFIRSEAGAGLSGRLAESVKNFRDPKFGVLKSKVRALDNIIKTSDKEIENKERMLTQRAESIKRRFSNLEGTLSGLKAQETFLKQRFGGGQKK